MKPCLLLQICQNEHKEFITCIYRNNSESQVSRGVFTVFYFNDHSGTKDYPMNSHSSYKTDHGSQNSKHTKN